MTKPRHFIELSDFSRDELYKMLGLIQLMKESDRHGVSPRLLKGMTLGMLFESSSLRTRVSFETATMELGGHTIYLKPGEIHLGVRETVYDTVQVLSRMCDGIIARTDVLERKWNGLGAIRLPLSSKAVPSMWMAKVPA